MRATSIVAVGNSDVTDSQKAGQEVATQALESLETRHEPSWVLAFCGGRHDPGDFLHGLRTTLGDVPVVGGAAIGSITNGGSGYSGFECAAAVFSKSVPLPWVLTETTADGDEYGAGRRLGSKLREAAGDGDSVLLFYDSLYTVGPPPVLHVGSRLMAGIHEELDGTALDLIGAGLLSDHQFSDGFLFDGRGVVRHSVLAVALPTGLDTRYAVMHGCVPISGFHEITRIDGAIIYELGGRPALEVLTTGGFTPEVLTLNCTLGCKHGDPFGPDEEANFVNRLIIGYDKQEGWIRLFEADFKHGDMVQIMSRSNELMMESAIRNVRWLVESTEGTEAVFALYIDCAGRASAICASETEEADAVREHLGEAIPLLGFYSGVEIAPIAGLSRPLDWTGVLTVFYRASDG
ncbi:MAG: FIST N-terminal domain-containing protein [Candidatus Thiodiazotropha endolucinida]